MKTLGPAGEDVFTPMSCITVPVSELGTFLKIDDTALVDVLVDLWDGQLTKWGHSTKTAGSIEIKNPWLNIIGCTTPSWLKAHFPEHLIGGGLTSRIVFVFGDTKRSLIAYPDEIINGKDYHDFEVKLKSDLLEISKLQGEYRLSSDARAWGHDWYKKHWTGDRPLYMASDRYGGYHSRKQTHIHKLAIVLSAARDDSRTIQKEHLVEAEQILNSSEKHMLRVFESIGMVDEARHVAELAAYVRAHEFLTSDQLYGLVRNIMSVKDFEESIKAAVRGGLLNVETRNGVKGVVPNKPTKH
jgi:hypothetical protein